MSSVRAIEIRGRSRKRLRRYAGARGRVRLAAVLLAAALAVALIGPSGAAAMPAGNGSPTSSGKADHSGLSPLDTLIAALGAHRAEKAVDAIGHGLALIEARKQVAATEQRLAKEAAAAPAEPEPAPVGEEVLDPSEMLPASAGTNGTAVPHSGGGPGGKLFAHTRATVDGSTAILLSGIALAPPDAPEAVQQVINAANTIVGRPYVWGGGHASFYSYGYDCSGSVSFALFGGGLIPEPLTSGSLEGWGEPGPGKWITVYANADHTFMEIAGLRWDTVGDARGTGPRWHLAPNDTSGFVVRHPPGL
jgi:cell wall-associated NlpC family hydrolase